MVTSTMKKTTIEIMPRMWPRLVMSNGTKTANSVRPVTAAAVVASAMSTTCRGVGGPGARMSQRISCRMLEVSGRRCDCGALAPARRAPQGVGAPSTATQTQPHQTRLGAPVGADDAHEDRPDQREQHQGQYVVGVSAAQRVVAHDGHQDHQGQHPGHDEHPLPAGTARGQQVRGRAPGGCTKQARGGAPPQPAALRALTLSRRGAHSPAQAPRT